MAATRSVVAVLVVGAAGLIAAAFTTSRSQPGRPADGASRTAPPAAGHFPAGPPHPRRTGAPSTPAPFTLTVSMRSGIISTAVHAISVASNEPVDPPHRTAAEWNTAVWVRQSTYPSTPARGTTYVYGHACHYHVCPFTHLDDARAGDLARVTTPSGTTTYRIKRIGLSPKAATSLPSWASDSTVPNRLVLVTCAYEQGDTSTSNIVVVARRIGS